MFSVEAIDEHTVVCQKPKCACPDCNKLEKDFQEKIKHDNLSFCSTICKYTYLLSIQVEKSKAYDPAKKALIAKSFAPSAKTIINQIMKDSCIHTKCKRSAVRDEIIDIPPEGEEPSRGNMGLPGGIGSFIPPPPPPPVPLPYPSSNSFKWDPDSCASGIVLSEENNACFLQEGGYCFRTVLANIGFTSGVHYWEIHADPRTENELKIGVSNRKGFNLNTVSRHFNNNL